MTIEKMCFVAPEDIKAVKVICGQCNTSTTILLDEPSKVANLIERNCIMCGTATGFQRDTREAREIILFSETLGRLAELMKGRNIKYSFQIGCPE